jgi:uncharacterized protein
MVGVRRNGGFMCAGTFSGAIASVAFAGLWLVEFIPDKALVYLMLGLTPFAVDVLPKSWRPDIEWRGVPFVTGIFTTIIQFMSGVGGLFLDIFFQKSRLDRKTTLATKAVVQTASHILRLVYFVSLTGFGPTLAPLPVIGAIALAIGGTMLAPYVIERMTDDGFRKWTRVVIYTICIVYLVRAASLYWQYWQAAA